jgi:hypothetical protein
MPWRANDGGELEVVAPWRWPDPRAPISPWRLRLVEPGPLGVAAPGQEAGGARAGRNGAGDVRPHAGVTVGEHVQRHAARGADLVGQAHDGLGRFDHGIVFRHRFRRGRVVGHERAEAEIREERVAALARGAAEGERLGLEGHRHVGVDRDELPGLARVVAVAPRFSPSPRRRRRAARRAIRGGDEVAGALKPAHPFTLSLVSPISASTSHTCDGSTPHFSFTAGASYHVPSSFGL